MKGRIIGALWIAIALGGAYFGFEGRLFGALFCFCLMMALGEILVIFYGEPPYGIQDEMMKYAPQTQALVLMMAAYISVSLTRDELALIVVVCTISDVGAFTVGKLMGRHKAKIVNHISPKKSYEGYVGGAILPIVAIWLCPLLGIQVLPSQVSYIVLGGLLAEIGDLLGSATKRRLGVKDSNEVLIQIPVFNVLEYPLKGHGGYLDRVDSMSLSLVGFVAIRLLASLC